MADDMTAILAIGTGLAGLAWLNKSKGATSSETAAKPSGVLPTSLTSAQKSAAAQTVSDLLGGNYPCADAVADGSIIGTQYFLAPGQSGQTQGLSYQGLQQGYVGPDGNWTGQDVTYAVFTPSPPNGQYYLVPQCG